MIIIIQKLIQRSQQGDHEAFEELFRQCQGVIYKQVNKFWLPCAQREDIYQEACIAFYYAVMAYSFDKGISFKSFARLVIERKLSSLVRLKTNKKSQILNNAYSLDKVVNENSPYPITYSERLIDLSYEQKLKRIEQPIMLEEIFTTAKLSKLEITILQMHLQGLTYEQMSRILNSSYKTVDNAMQRVRRKIKKHQEELLQQVM